MSELWSLPGYDVLSPRGPSDLGELWRAREQATGDVVVLQRLRDDVDPAAVEQLRAQAPVLRSLETPYVLRLRALVEDGTGAVLVLDQAPTGSLAALLARRGTLEPGEVVTIAAPLASALAVAHGRGVVHGDLSAEQVLFAGDGMPLLSGLGLSGLRPGRCGEAGPEQDVRALAGLCHRMLGGAAAPGEFCDDAGDEPVPLSVLLPGAPRALVEAVERGLRPDPASRPDAAAFAALLRRAHPASPVRLTGGPARVASVVSEGRVGHGPDARTPPRPAARRAPSGGQLAAVGLVVLVAVGAAGGWAWGRSAGDTTGVLPPAGALPSAEAAAASADPPALPPTSWPAEDTSPPDRGEPLSATSTRTPTPTPTPTPTSVPSPVPAASAGPAPERPSAVAAPPAEPSPDWSAVLDELDTARAKALALADASALRAVHAPSSSALAADTRLVEQLAAAGHRALGVRHAFRAVEVLDQREDRVRLRVVDVLAEHEVRDAAGAVVRRAAARGDVASVVELARTPAGWRIVQITAA